MVYLFESHIMIAAKIITPAITATSHNGLGLWLPGMKVDYIWRFTLSSQ